MTTIATATARDLKGRALRRARIQESRGSETGLREVLGSLLDKGALTQRQIAAGEWLYGLINRRSGWTGSSSMNYMERIHNSRRPTSSPAGWSEADDDLIFVLDRLRPTERDLLTFLLLFSERPTGRRALHYWITERCGIDAERTTATRWATGHVQALLNGIADLRDMLVSGRSTRVLTAA